MTAGLTLLNGIQEMNDEQVFCLAGEINNSITIIMHRSQVNGHLFIGKSMVIIWISTNNDYYIQFNGKMYSQMLQSKQTYSFSFIFSFFVRHYFIRFDGVDDSWSIFDLFLQLVYVFTNYFSRYFLLIFLSIVCFSPSNYFLKLQVKTSFCADFFESISEYSIFLEWKSTMKNI